MRAVADLGLEVPVDFETHIFPDPKQIYSPITSLFIHLQIQYERFRDAS